MNTEELFSVFKRVRFAEVFHFLNNQETFQLLLVSRRAIQQNSQVLNGLKSLLF